MQELKKRFEIPGLVRIAPGNGDLTRLVVTTNRASGEIYLHGAHVSAFQPVGQKPVVWMSGQSMFQDGKPIRGGVPICFPWFGPRAGDPKAPPHGFARLHDWSLDSVAQTPDRDVVVTMSLRSDDATRALWPFDFIARHVVTFGPALEMKLEIRNTSQKSIRFDEALHTYFAVGDVRQATVEGLGGATYVDKAGEVRTLQQTDPLIRFTGETDRVYLDTQATCIINDPVMNRRIEVTKTGSNATVVWNPWITKSKAMPDFGDDEWPGMVCVETVNALKLAVDLAPGATHVMSQRVRVI
jgi:D-hexose-6-phosphate mutarotase